MPLSELVVPSEVTQNRFSRKLLHNWVDRLSTISASPDRDPIINKARLVDMLSQAQLEHRPLVLVAIGCQDWVKPDWGEENTDFTIGRIRADGKRPKRFIKELASFGEALNTFNIPHRIHFSLSNVEPLIHMNLNNMGVTIHNPESAPEYLEANVDDMARNINAFSPDAVVQFDHLKLLQELMQQTDLRAIQQMIAGKVDPSYRDFLDNLYAFDLKHTASHFVQSNEIGPVWLDIQSFNFHDDVASLTAAASTVAPEMPILSIFPNAGNWRAAGAADVTFSSKSEEIAHLLGVQQVPLNQDQWLNKIHRTNDQTLTSVLSEVTNDEIVINDGQQKTLMARLFFMLAFGFDPSNVEAL